MVSVSVVPPIVEATSMVCGWVWTWAATAMRHLSVVPVETVLVPFLLALAVGSARWSDFHSRVEVIEAMRNRGRGPPPVLLRIIVKTSQVPLCPVLREQTRRCRYTS